MKLFNLDKMKLNCEEDKEAIIKRESHLTAAATIGIRITAGVTGAILSSIIAKKIKGE